MSYQIRIDNDPSNSLNCLTFAQSILTKLNRILQKKINLDQEVNEVCFPEDLYVKEGAVERSDPKKAEMHTGDR
ncbi:hypothetical protein GCM10007415_16800 [Parapedobacter pyrenivorans]|uniref:Uncharacterized protein n=1 Tax=Parapedobacter pyrenivorans TaxID=1305674 RepID=A0A917M8G1_9SPHI|nr:hypothetical protein GCM10007415_16800 [Parapedobacter pyrenivorans]